MEPVSAGGMSASAKALGLVKDWPLWLFVAIALCLSVLLAVPSFRGLVPTDAQPLLWFGSAAAWIFVLVRGAKPAFLAVRSYRERKEAQRRFRITAIEHQCYWGVSKQPDGSFVTQISGHFMVKNRSAEKLHLMSGRVVKPRIPGEVLPGLLATRAPDAAMYGTPHVSGNFIPPGETLPVAGTFLIKGTPKQESGPMKSVIAFTDADGYSEMVAVTLRNIAPVKR
jgi:hypothetical protein